MMRKFILFLAGAALACSQQYTISTFAGGAPPTTPAPAGNVSVGQPRRVGLDRSGNVYFSALNSVYKLTSGGVLTLVAGNSRAGYSGDGGPAVNAQLNSPQGVAVDSAGNIYIADSLNNRVRQITPDGIIHNFAGNGSYSTDGPGSFGDGGTATDARLRQPTGLAVNSSGVVYIADTGDNIVRKVTSDGLISLVAGDGFASFAGDLGPATAAELNHPGDLAFDSSGNIYIADTGNARIRKITSDGNINTIAGAGAQSSTGDGAAATKATLYAPMSVSLDGSNNIYILENGDSRIRKIDSSGNISTIAGTGVAGFAGDGSAASNAQMNFPTGMAIDSSGNLYIADTLNGRVRKISSNNISSIAGNGVLSYSGDGGLATSAQMNYTFAVAADSSGNVYIADSANHVVRRVAKSGVITTFAGNGNPGFGGDGGAAASAQLNSPQGVAVDAAGNVYIADTQNDRIRRVTPTGAISTYAGNGTPGFGGDGGAAASAQVDTPVGLAVDAGSNLYIADLGNSRIRRVSSAGTITTIAGNGIAGYTSDGGQATSAALNLPQGVAVDAGGTVYIADTGNNRVRRVAGGTITTIAGNGVADFTGDGGQATSATIGSPIGIAADTFGTVYVTDSSSRVRRIVAGFITTIAGNGSRGYSGDGGAATSAMLNGPTGLAVDSTGNVYIADSGNNAVRMLQPAASALAISAVVNGASNRTGPLAPGSVVVIYGSGLGPATLVQAPAGQNLPTSLAGTTVLFGNALAPVLYTSATQVAAMVPFDITQGNAGVSVGYQGQFSTPASVSIAPVAPALFTLNSSGSGQVLALNDNGSGGINDAGHPAKNASFVILYLTGAGQTTPAGENGRIFSGASPKLPAAGLATASIGGKTATVSFAGTAVGVVEGVMQVNVQIPDGLPAGNATIVVQLGGQQTQSGVTIAVGP